MKEKINYTLQENFRWYFKRVKKYHRVLILQMIAMVILESLQSILLVLLPTVLVSSLVTHVSLGIFAFRVFGLGLLLAVIIYLLGLVEATTTGYKIDLRSNIGVEINEANLKTDYQNLEMSEFRLIHQMAEDNGVGNNAAGAEAFYTHISLLARKISSFILFSLTLTVIRPSLFLIVLGTTIINYYALKWVRNYREKIKKSRGEVQARLKYLEQNAYAVENGKDIRLYQMDSWYQEHIKENIAESDKWQERLSTREFISSSIQDVTMFGRNILAYLFLIIKIIKGTMSLTDFTLFFTILNQLTAYLNEITLTLNELTRASQDLNDIRYYLDVASASIPQEIEISAEIQALQAQPNYRFRLDNVSYTYPGSQEATIAGLDLTIAVGEKLALVGANGAGKSTLVKLISGLIRPTSGTIYLNDIDISEIPQDYYFELIAPVFQEASVLAFDLGHNVALANEYDDVSVENCLIQAGLGEKLAKLPQGLKTAMTTYVDLQGVSFSGGEEQKLMLARALYKNSGMLILDEPTAALDAIAESDLYEKYNELTIGKTSLFISHRLASTRFCDRIIFLSEGVIKESGSHEELLAEKGEYAAMYEIQSRYYQKEVV